jgi:hypothetical protein
VLAGLFSQFVISPYGCSLHQDSIEVLVALYLILQADRDAVVTLQYSSPSSRETPQMNLTEALFRMRKPLVEGRPGHGLVAMYT